MVEQGPFRDDAPPQGQGKPDDMDKEPLNTRQEPAKTPAQGKMGTLAKLPAVLFHPGPFFDRVKSESGYGPPFKFHIVLVVINIAILYSAYFLIGSALTSFMEEELATDVGMLEALNLAFMAQVLNSSISFISLLLFAFIGAAFQHFFVLILGGKGGYQNTYKAMVYSSTPELFLWLGTLLIILGIRDMSFLYAGFGFIVAILIWTFIVLIKGLSRLHSVSAFRAFLFLVAPVLILMLLVMPIAVALYALGIFNPATYTMRTCTGFQEIGCPMDWMYESNGDLSVMLRNNFSESITIVEVTAECGPSGSDIPLVTSGSTAIGPGSFITYATGSQKCISIPSGESFSTTLSVSYTRQNGLTVIDSGVIRGSAV